MDDRTIREPVQLGSLLMKSIFTLFSALLTSGALAQNPTGSGSQPAANSSNDPGSFQPVAPMQELAPPTRPGRAGGVYITGSTAPDLPGSNGTARGSSGSGVRSNSGYGAGGGTVASTNNSPARTNSDASTTITQQDVTNAPAYPGAGVLYPAVLPAPVPPGTYPPGTTLNQSGATPAVGGTPSAVPGFPPPTLTPPPPPGAGTTPGAGTGASPAPAPNGFSQNPGVPGFPPPTLTPPPPPGAQGAGTTPGVGTGAGTSQGRSTR